MFFSSFYTTYPARKIIPAVSEINWIIRFVLLSEPFIVLCAFSKRCYFNITQVFIRLLI